MRNHKHREHPELRDYGNAPFIFNIEQATNMNQNFRTALWTGEYMQLTLMSIPVCGDIGVEMHPDVDQLSVLKAVARRSIWEAVGQIFASVLWWMQAMR